MTKKIEKLKCLRCGYEWYPRTPGRPYVCPNPKCHSPRWDNPKLNRKLRDSNTKNTKE
jgi:predicted Zn-ribbon and HTH transcriptional regulator